MRALIPAMRGRLRVESRLQAAPRAQSAHVTAMEQIAAAFNEQIRIFRARD